MKTGSIIRWVITTLVFSLTGVVSVTAKPHHEPAVRPIIQPGNSHQTRPVNRPNRPQQRPPSYHRPPNVTRPPTQHRPPSYHRPPSHRPPSYHRPPPVVVRPPHHHRTYISVSSGYRYPPYRGHYYFYHRDLVDIATFAIFAGITYAIINDAYYQKSGDRYVYVQNPPAGNYTIIDPNDIAITSSGTTSSTSSNAASNSPYTKGEIIDTLPSSKKTVVVNGQTYFQYQNTWFLPLRDQHKYVVVEPPL
ncbi:hypothetical protein LCL85_13035 [Vibrio alginolyticus]|nr:hypothetical protein [Vibrio alginolyticus]